LKPAGIKTLELYIHRQIEQFPAVINLTKEGTENNSDKIPKNLIVKFSLLLRKRAMSVTDFLLIKRDNFGGRGKIIAVDS
jgi:hypothetical protein